MSRIVEPRPTASQRNRGRGRGQTNNVQPAVRGERVSPSRGTSQSVRGRGGAGGSVAAGGTGNTTFAGGARGRGTTRRGGAVSRGGGRMYQQGMDYDENADDAASSPAEDSVQQRAAYVGGYTMISPNEKKRRQVMEQAAREAQQYEEYKQRNKPTSFSYVGTAGGGEVGTVDEASARQQQIRTHNMHSKTSRLLKNEERKSQQKLLEDKELERKKAEARKKADLNAQREAQRANSARSDMRRVNNAFLDRLEAQAKTAAATTQSQQQTSLQPQQHSNPSRSLQSNNAGLQHTTSSQTGQHRTTHAARQHITPTPAGQHTASNCPGGRQPLSTNPQVSAGSQRRQMTTTTFSAAQSYPERHVNSESFPQAGGTSFSEQPADAEFYDNLEQLVNMFPGFDEDMLHSILQQCNGSMEHALELLEM